MSEKELRNKVIELLSKTSFFGGIEGEEIDFFIEKLVKEVIVPEKISLRREKRQRTPIFF